MSYQAAETERRLMGVIRYATVTDVDTATARARVTFGGGTSSAWMPFASSSVGAARFWTPPVVGEQVIVAAPCGDTAQGVIMGSVPCDAFPAPSTQAGEVVVDIGASRLTITDADATLAVGGAEIVISDASIAIRAAGSEILISGSGVSVTSAGLSHNGTNVGHDHVHGGVVIGPDITDGPI